MGAGQFDLGQSGDVIWNETWFCPIAFKIIELFLFYLVIKNNTNTMKSVDINAHT